MKRIATIMLCLSMLLASCGTADGQLTDSQSISGAVQSALMASSAVTSEVEPIIPDVNNYEQMSYKVLDIKDHVQITGRSIFSKYGAVVDNVGSGVRFRLDCEGDVSVTMSVHVSATTCANRYYTVIVDGERRDRVSLKAIISMRGEYELPIATGLERGEHTFEIYRATPAENGSEDVAEIKCNGVPITPPERKELYVEFFGDSITAGLASMPPDKSENTYSPDYCDGIQTYAFYVADKIGAEYSGICRGGQPFTYEYGGLTAEEYYLKYTHKRDLGDYDFSRKADVVVINLGTNGLADSALAQKNLTRDDAKKMAVDLLKLVREKNPDAKIVWAYGMISNYNSQIIRDALAEMGGDDAGFYYCAMTNYSYSHGGHPRIEEHIKSGEQLLSFFETKLGIKAVK